MHKGLFIGLISLFLFSCQTTQNPGENPATIPPLETQTEQVQEMPKPEKTGVEAVFTENTEWPEFNGKLGDRITLEKDFCINDLCIYKDHPAYQGLNGHILQFANIELEEIFAGNENEAAKYLPKILEYVEVPLTEHLDEEHIKNAMADGSNLFATYKHHEKLADEKGYENVTGLYLTVSANPRKSTISSSYTAGLSVVEKSYQRLGDVISKTDATYGCGGGSYEQIFLDTENKEITNIFDAFPKAPKTLEVNGTTLILQENDMKNLSSGVYIAGYSEADIDGISDISLNENLEKQLIKERVGPANYYHIQFTEYPQTTFVYKNTAPRAMRYLTGSLVQTPTNEKGDVISLDDTLKILKEEELISDRTTFIDNKEITKDFAVSIRKKNDSDNYNGLEIEKLSEDMLPIFSIKKLPNGDGLLYLKDTYEEFTTAELCKPLVYVYDKNSAQNSLTVHLPQGGTFTKLIPHFSHGNTWDFTANITSKILSEKPNLDYLYYSARVPNYTFNRDGWQVYGRDMEHFFNEKLDYIGFNATEKKDFIDFWKTEFHENQVYFVSFKFDENINKWATLDFQRKPKTQMRVLLEAYPLKKAHSYFLYPNTPKIFDEKILNTFVRSGEFDVFEWGGVVQKDFNQSFIIQ